MNIEVEKIILLSMAALALFSGQLFMFIFLLGFSFVWEDAKWPSFDADNYDHKMMHGPLKPWEKGN